MRLSISRSGTRLSPRTRSYIERRAYFRLSRFSTRVTGIRIRLAGPASQGAPRTCTVIMTVRGSRPLVVEQEERRLTAVVDLALARAARLLARTVELLDGRMTRADRWRIRPRG